MRVEPGMSMPREIEMTLTGKLFQRLTKGSLKPEFERFAENESDEFLNVRSSNRVDRSI